MTPAEAADRMKAFRLALPLETLRMLDRAAKKAVRLSIKKFMERKDRNPEIDPPNPPPGPLAIRSGKLARSVKVVAAKRVGEGRYTFAITAGGGEVDYAAIHEYGGTTRAHAIVARNTAFLRFKPRGSDDYVFRRRVWHPGSRIEARPYLMPALAEATEGLREEVKAMADRLARRMTGQRFR